MFEVIVCLEKGIFGEEFDENVFNVLNVVGERLVKIKNDFGCMVMLS